MSKKYLIYSPPYNPNSGGAIVLHKLCSILNDLGHEAYLIGYQYHKEITARDISLKLILSLARNKFFRIKKDYDLCERYNTQIYNGDLSNLDQFIVVYPEIISGNPLKAKNVVRWLLHKPGFFSGKIHYGTGELYFKYRTGFCDDFKLPGSVTSSNYLNITDIPRDIYNLQGALSDSQRKGVAFCLRKGAKKIRDEHLPIDEEIIIIDGMSHKEISDVFKRVRKLISYDTDTAYSRLAVLCGCKSIVIPKYGISKESWKPSPELRYGIHYGLDDDLGNIDNERCKLVKLIESEVSKSIKNASVFVEETGVYFS